MPYNTKQYDAALPFLRGADENVVDVWDQKRIQVYDLYENIYINSIQTLKIQLRGDDSVPLIMPSGRKIVEATNRFLGVNFDYLVESEQGDEATRQAVDDYMRDWFKREAIRATFGRSKRWGLIRGDAILYIHADPKKKSGERISITELDPRQVFLIEDTNARVIGCHITEIIQDFRSPDDDSKKIARRRTFRKTRDDSGNFTGEVTSELTHWESDKWDDRNLKPGDMKKVSGGDKDEEEEPLLAPISELPIYRWRNNPMQNTFYGCSVLAGFETLMYGINQSLTDEDATMVFQGLGMYVTNAAPPVDPNTGEVTDWNIGPMQIIEIGTEQTFTRVTGVDSLEPFQNHMNFMDEKGLSEGGGIPEVAIGRVDVTIAESGIALNLQFMPLLAANAEKEEEIIVTLDQMLHDVTTMWLPAYEPELFSNAELLQEISCVCVFDDPMPKNRDAEVQETLLLRTSNLILTTMAIAKLRKLGWEFPSVGPDGVTPLTDDDIAAMLLKQANDDACVGLGAVDDGTGVDDGSGLTDNGDGTFTDQDGNLVDADGNPLDDTGQPVPDQTTIPLGVS